MTIYQIEELLESIGYKDYTPQHIPAEWIQARPEYDNAEFIPRENKWGTPTSFEPGNDNSKAVEAARKATKGKPQSEQHKANKAKALNKKCCVNGAIYNSVTEAARALGVGKPAISNRIKRGHTAWLI